MLTQFSFVSEAGANHVSNEVNVTVLFPDNSGDINTSGGFKTQDEFREFLFKNPGARVKHAFHTRPTGNRQHDYDVDEFVKAFPLQFPFGYGGFPKQKQMIPFFEGKKNKLEDDVLLRHLLRHRKPDFHRSDFNLVTNTVLMKSEVFRKVRLQCSLSFKDAKLMGEKYGEMSGIDVNNSVAKVRAEVRLSPQSQASDKFLQSVSAVCADLPHSNEATIVARDEYFSMIVQFGLPALFVTISPDDQRSVWIKVYLLKDQSLHWNREPDIDSIEDKEIIAEYRQRVQDRVKYPGLCAEDYIAITEVFLKHVLQWDAETESARKEGLFGFTEAFTQATEEQGRKTLHGHFLVWIKGWNDLLHRVMERSAHKPPDQKEALLSLRDYVRHCASAKMFEDFEPNNPLSETPLFKHEGCKSGRSARKNRHLQFAVKPIDEIQMAEMRRADKCFEHRGHIATCSHCNRAFSIHEVAETCLNGACHSALYEYPDKKRRRLDRLVYELQKDFTWFRGSEKSKAKRKFVSNLNTNLHNITHTPRCFKKEITCYTKFPVPVNEDTKIRFAESPSQWADFDGTIKDKWIFEVVPERPIQDVFTNIHNPLLTMLFLCNNNILTAMTGAVVLYVTSYSSKKNQKEERLAFENMAIVLTKVLERQVRAHKTFICRTGVKASQIPSFCSRQKIQTLREPCYQVKLDFADLYWQLLSTRTLW